MLCPLSVQKLNAFRWQRMPSIIGATQKRRASDLLAIGDFMGLKWPISRYPARPQF
jgi:hypothetical protein